MLRRQLALACLRVTPACPWQHKGTRGRIRRDLRRQRAPRRREAGHGHPRLGAPLGGALGIEESIPEPLRVVFEQHDPRHVGGVVGDRLPVAGGRQVGTEELALEDQSVQAAVAENHPADGRLVDVVRAR